MERKRRTERDGRGGYRLDDARWTSVRRVFRPGRCSREERGEDAVFVMAAAQGKTRKRKPVSSFGPWRVWKGDRERDEPRGNVEYDLSSRERKADPVRKASVSLWCAVLCSKTHLLVDGVPFSKNDPPTQKSSDERIHPFVHAYKPRQLNRKRESRRRTRRRGGGPTSLLPPVDTLLEEQRRLVDRDKLHEVESVLLRRLVDELLEGGAKERGAG